MGRKPRKPRKPRVRGHLFDKNPSSHERAHQKSPACDDVWAGPFTASDCDVYAEGGGHDGAAVFDVLGQPFALIADDLCVGGRAGALARAQYLADLLNQQQPTSFMLTKNPDPLDDAITRWWETLPAIDGLLEGEGDALITFDQLRNAMREAGVIALLAAGHLRDDDAVPPGITHQHHVHATQEAASLAHELDVLVTRVEGMGNQLLVARASTFVTTLAKDVTRFLTNPGTVLRHPSLDFDLLCTQADVHDDGRVFCHLRAYGGEDDRSYMFQFDSLYPAGLVDDVVRVLVRGLTEAVTVDTIAKMREAGVFNTEQLADPPQSETVHSADGEVVADVVPAPAYPTHVPNSVTVHDLSVDPDQVVTVYGKEGQPAQSCPDCGFYQCRCAYLEP